MYKAARNRPLIPTQRITNRFISSLRYKVEQTIGRLKRAYHFIRMRYKGLAKGDKGIKMPMEGKNLRVRGYGKGLNYIFRRSIWIFISYWMNYSASRY